MPEIISCLWFDGQAEAAAELYTSLFPRSEITGTAHYGPEVPDLDGTVMTVDFVLDGTQFVGLNGGPQFPFTEAVSFQIHTADQAETDHYWDGLIAGGGEASRCGWLKDRFGVSWQVTPTVLLELLKDPDPARAQRVTRSMLGMDRIDIAELHRAADQA